MKEDIVVKYDITYKCNYCCDYCTFANNNMNCLNNSYEPTKTDIDNMFYNLSRYNIKKFILYGGEPTLSENILYCIDKLLEYNNVCTIDVCTNGHNISMLDILCDRYGAEKFFIYYGIHLKFLDIKKISHITHRFNKFMLNIVLDKRYSDKLYALKDYIQEKNFPFLLSYIKTKRNSYNKRLPFNSNEYSDVKFLIECCKLFDYDIHKIYERFNTPKDFFNKVCVNNLVDIKPNGDLCFDCLDCFSSPTLGNVYNTEYIHNFQSVVCNIKIPNNFGYCCWCDHHK